MNIAPTLTSEFGLNLMELPAGSRRYRGRRGDFFISLLILLR